MLKTRMKIFTSIVCSFAGIGLFACNRATPAPDFGIDVLEPFGFTWEKSNLQPKSIIGECNRETNKLRSIYTVSELESLVAHCKSESYDIVFFPKRRLPKAFRDGEIGVLINGDGQPFSYTFSYLHELSPTTKSVRKKHIRADALKKTITEIYGEPLAKGYYAQFNRIGFIPDETIAPECFFWKQNQVGILLCRERVIYVDGFEMSLSFIRTDNFPYGIALQERVNQYIEKGKFDLPEDDDIENDEYEKSFLASVRRLSEWMKSPYKACEQDTLQPLEKAWEITENDKKRVAPLLEKYNGDELAELIFEHEELPDWIWKKDNVVLYLLKYAADDGNADAMNEIAYSQLRCAFGVEQNRESGKRWIAKAIEGGSYSGYANQASTIFYEGPPSKQTRQNAMGNLQKCVDLGGENCGVELRALKTLNEIIDAGK
ncbi:SEL1-like repeat protein [Robiginitomaculum antarcticum]|uniref:sel1 repeat family protein n=1 Tax=Robiginitomaculum antarcticum TaxID=437507 RepID=UPI0003763539|nr:sel1 repeat family protein [Robiginitomaculum antarcticum]